MLTVFLYSMVLLFSVIALILFKLGFTVLKADPREYRLNKEISDSPLKGTLKNQGNDSRSQAGMIINNKNEWVEQGRISDEAIDSVLN
jgi:hypothetical protein